MADYPHLNQFGSLVASLQQQATAPSGAPEGFSRLAWMRANRLFLDRFTGAQRFVVPELGRTFIGTVDSYDDKHAVGLRLPYSSIALLGELDHDLGAGSKPTACFVYSTAPVPHVRCDHLALSPETVWCLAAHRHQGAWVVDPVGIAFDPLLFVRGEGFRVLPFPVATCDVDFWHRHYMTDGGDAMESHKVAGLVDLCCALMCRNVFQREVAPDPYKAERRAKAGKAPLYSYKLLEIDPGDDDSEGGRTAFGDRASPRTHLRRGHMRWLERSQRFVWVNACMVRGATPGIVVKDYSVK